MYRAFCYIPHRLSVAGVSADVKDKCFSPGCGCSIIGSPVELSSDFTYVNITFRRTICYCIRDVSYHVEHMKCTAALDSGCIFAQKLTETDQINSVSISELHSYSFYWILYLLHLIVLFKYMVLHLSVMMYVSYIRNCAYVSMLYTNQK